MTERDKIVDKLQELNIRFERIPLPIEIYYEVADYVLLDRRRVLDAVEKPLKDMKGVITRFELEWGTCLENKAIDEVLAVIAERRKG